MSSLQPSEDQGKATAIISYITPVGWLVAYFALYKDNKTSLAAFHLRQSLGFMIVVIGLYIVQIILFFLLVLMGMIGLVTMTSFLFSLIYLGLLALWILGLIAAINEKEQPMPLIGRVSQNIFFRL